MKVTTNWLRNCLGRTILSDVSDQQIVQALEQSGLEVEQVIYSHEIDPLVISCSVKKVIQHPSADKLKIVELSTGKIDLTVVCGAPNVREGMNAALAQVGATLPSGDKIGIAKLRGIESSGMLCSPQELGLGDDHSGLLVLDDSIQPGVELADLYPSDTIIDVKTPANRFDVQSICGIARDIAAMLGKSVDLEMDLIRDFVQNTAVIDRTDGNRPLLLVKLNINPESQTPDWMVARLRSVGQRSKGLLVDITNFVMFETGQPLHAYDAAKVSWPLQVRTANDGEKLVTLDGVERKLTTDDLVIADQDGPVALAGVMGGQSSEVGATTHTIWLEAGVFDAVKIRKTAQRHGMRTEGSARFERRLPPQMPQVALTRAIELFKTLAGASVEAMVWGGDNQLPKPIQITIEPDWVQRMLGLKLTMADMKMTLRNLGFGIEEVGDLINVTVPWWRPDINGREDILEELVRVLGYGKIPATLPTWRPQQVNFDHLRQWRERVCQTLSAAGLFEVMTYSFVAGEQIDRLESTYKHLELQNPLSAEQSYLRTGLLASHLRVAERNRTYAKSFAYYEISKVFWPSQPGELPHEPLLLGLTAVRPHDAYIYVKGLLDELSVVLGVPMTVRPAQVANMATGRAGEVVLHDVAIGHIGQVKPSIVKSHKIERELAGFEIDLQPVFASVRPQQYVAPARFPTIQRDISVWLPIETTWAKVKETLSKYDIEFVGEYRGTGTPVGQRGLTLRLTIAHDDHTPTEAEASAAVTQVTDLLGRTLSAVSRG